MKKSSLLVGLMLIVLPFTVMASEAGPYLIGEWGLGDFFKDGTTPVTITDTSVTFVNPTSKTQVLEYAFFDDDGGFCGCDRDFPGPNAITRYTMSGERTGGMFACTAANGNLKTHGAVKTIVFERGTRGGIAVGTAMTLGFQTHFFGTDGNQRTEADQKSIALSDDIMTEMRAVHQLCVDFCDRTGVCPPLP